MNSLSYRLTIIRNGEKASRPYIEISCTKHFQYKKNIFILNQLRQEGVIRGYSYISLQSKINKNINDKIINFKIIIFLKYDETGKSVLRIIQQVSTPGRRKYVSTHSL